MFGIHKKVNIDTDPTKIEELLTRGVENVYPTPDFLRSKLKKGERLTIYLGIDPTGPTLHIGHIIPIKKLGQFQKLGHQIILLMGDFTAMIGDPTDKSATRKKLTHEEVIANLKRYKEQASKFISFEGENPALIKYNSEWLGKMNFHDVLELTSLMTVEQMSKRDMFVRRTEEGKPTYIHEFLYPLMQGYDSVAMDVDGEVGGNDQTFNMLTGRDLMKTLKNKEKFVITTKLLTDSSGKKMGKTENNLVSFDLSPEDIFGKVMSWGDDVLMLGFEIITNVEMSEIEEMKKALESGANPKEIKMRLAREIIQMYFGKNEAEKAQESFENTFSKGGTPDEVVEVSVAEGTLLVDVLLAENIVSSKSDFRRLVSEGAISKTENSEKISNIDAKIENGIYKIGKRRFIKIKVI
ncbi:MAG: tyrosine--tRNA ligase [bacterium]